jgi:hypothetical protein
MQYVLTTAVLLVALTSGARATDAEDPASFNFCMRTTLLPALVLATLAPP